MNATSYSSVVLITLRVSYGLLSFFVKAICALGELAVFRGCKLGFWSAVVSVVRCPVLAWFVPRP